jgi:type II secretory pathway component GspD/PulD (secretin)
MNYKNKKGNILFFILILFLIISFVVNANSQCISFTNIWYKKMPNYTHLTIKASEDISEYEVSYMDNPERIIIDVKNAIYTIEELSKNILFLNMGEVKQVRCGQLEIEPVPIVRFVVDLFQKADYEVTLSAENRLIYIDVFDYDEFKAPEEQVFTVTPVKGEDIKIEKEEELKISILDIYTQPVNLNIFEEDIVNVIRGLSELTGIDMMLDDSVTGLLTLNLSNKTFREAIELILMNKGLDYTEVSDTLIIASKDIIQGYVKPVTKIIELKNASAEVAKGILDGYKAEGAKINIVADTRMNTLILKGTEEEIEKVINLLPTIDTELFTRTFKIDNAIEKEEIDAIKSMLTIIVPEEDRINIDSRQSEIIVKGSQEELDNVATMIVGLDKRAPQIMLEAKIVEISLADEKDLGIKWTSGSTTDDEGNPIEGQITIGELTLGGSFERSGLIEATLKALQTEGKTNILSNPKVLTLDGKVASIETGKQIPLIKTDDEGGTTVEYKKVGLTLTITPYLSTDKSLTMDTFVTINSLGAEVYQGYPVINSREEKVIIRTNLEETVIIGGLITSEEIKNTTEIPILGKIPIFGELFKFTNTSKEKTEIIIMITAHLIDY